MLATDWGVCVKTWGHDNNKSEWLLILNCLSWFVSCLINFFTQSQRLQLINYVQTAGKCDPYLFFFFLDPGLFIMWYWIEYMSDVFLQSERSCWFYIRLFHQRGGGEGSITAPTSSHCLNPVALHVFSYTQKSRCLLFCFKFFMSWMTEDGNMVVTSNVGHKLYRSWSRSIIYFQLVVSFQKIKSSTGASGQRQVQI